MLQKNFKAQSTIEFTFAMVAIMFLIYGMIQIFRWAGMDLANRRVIQDSSIINLNGSSDPSAEFNSDLDGALPLTAVYHGSVINGEAK